MAKMNLIQRQVDHLLLNLFDIHFMAQRGFIVKPVIYNLVSKMLFKQNIKSFVTHVNQVTIINQS